MTKLHGVLRTAISHTQCTIEGYAGTDHHTVVGCTQVTVHCHASNATCYVLLCYWRIIDVALASRIHPYNEPTRIAGNLVYMRITYTRLVHRKKRHVSIALRLVETRVLECIEYKVIIIVELIICS